MGKQKTIAWLILSGILLGACAAPARWSHPSLPSDQWSIDQATCKHRANRLIDRELARRNPLGDSGRTTLERNFQHFDATKRRNNLFAQCLRGKGYVKDPPKPGKSA
jgi:hypothetical protein